MWVSAGMSRRAVNGCPAPTADSIQRRPGVSGTLRQRSGQARCRTVSSAPRPSTSSGRPEQRRGAEKRASGFLRGSHACARGPQIPQPHAVGAASSAFLGVPERGRLTGATGAGRVGALVGPASAWSGAAGRERRARRRHEAPSNRPEATQASCRPWRVHSPSAQCAEEDLTAEPSRSRPAALLHAVHESWAATGAQPA